MNISLTEEFNNYVQQKVRTGPYHSASEVVQEGLRLLQEQDAHKKARLAEIGQKIDLGIQQIERGEYTEIEADELSDFAEAIKAEGRKRLARRSAA